MKNTGGDVADHAAKYNMTAPIRDENIVIKPLLPRVSLLFQVILSAALGSFLFGFNLSLLNTAADAIFSEYQLCGLPDNKFIFFTPANCVHNKTCHEVCKPTWLEEGKSIDYLNCPGGYNDLRCKSFEWLKAGLSCAVLVGAAIGCLSAGRFLSYGRRKLLIFTMIIFLIGIISSVCANSFSALFWARLIVGFGVGLISVAAPTYMAEMSPAEERGRYGVFHQLFIVIGIFIGVLLGLPLTDPRQHGDDWVPGTFQRFWWRFMLASGLLPVLFCLYVYLFFFKFETPHYYVEVDRKEDAKYVLQTTHNNNRQATAVEEELQDINKNVEDAKLLKQQGLTFMSAMSDPKYRGVIIIGCVLSAFQQFGGINVFMTSSNTLFEKAGLTGSYKTLMTCLMALLNVLMTFPTIYLIEKLGRRTLLLSGAIAQFVIVIPAAIAYWIDKTPSDPSSVTRGLAIIAVLGFVVFFAVGYGPVLWVYLFEIYPMEIKNVASASATAVNWVSGIIMVFIANVLENRYSFSLFAVLQLIGAIFIYFYMLETKGRQLGDSPYMQEDSAKPYSV